MTKQEAIEQMENGVKITHDYFAYDEWMTIKNNRIITEDGYSHSKNEFWAYRTDERWDNGYSIFEEPESDSEDSDEEPATYDRYDLDRDLENEGEF